MTARSIVGLLSFALIAVGTQGPANVLIAATAANVGSIRGTPWLLGVVALGLGSAIVGGETVQFVMRWVGSVLWLWLAYQIATSGPLSDAEEKRPIGFRAAAALQWLNPKSQTVCGQC